MTSDRTSIEVSLPSLSLGNIVTVGLKVFFLNAKAMVLRSVLAFLWLSLGLIGGCAIIFFGSTVIGTAVGMGMGFVRWVQVLAIIVGGTVGTVLAIPLMLWAGARFIAAGGLMSLTGVHALGQTDESYAEAKGRVFKKKWAFLRSFLVYCLMLIAIYGSFSGLAGFAMVLAIPLGQAWNSALTNPQTAWIVGLSVVLLALAFVLGLGLAIAYVSARFWLFDVVLAMETTHSGMQALSRSWELTKTHGWGVMTVMFISTLVTLPVSLVGSLVNELFPKDLMGVVLSLAVSLVLSVLLFPVWQAIKSTHYYELASARTGLIFDLREHSSHPQRYLRRVKIQTPEGVDLDFSLGGIGSRVFAWIVDFTILLLVLSVTFAIGAIAYAYVILPLVTRQFANVSVDDLNLWAVAIAGLAQFVLANGYFIYWETVWRGQTPGKRLAKIRIVRDNGQPIGVKEATLRSFLSWIDLGFLFIGFILVLWHRSEKRLGDIVAGTLVIQDEKVPQSKPWVVPTTFPTLTHDTVEILIAQANLSQLSAEHYLVLQHFLAYRPQMNVDEQTQVTAKLAQQLRELLWSNGTKSLGTIPDENLVEAAYLSYRIGDRSAPRIHQP